MKIVIASDHAGLSLKSELVSLLKEKNVAHDDLGPATADSVDYPDFAAKVATAVAAQAGTLGVLICGTGIGMSIAANKVKGIRAALCHTEFEARMARQHNDANVLCLGQRVTGAGVARAIAQVFIETAFEGGRHALRLEKLES